SFERKQNRASRRCFARVGKRHIASENIGDDLRPDGRFAKRSAGCDDLFYPVTAFEFVKDLGKTICNGFESRLDDIDGVVRGAKSDDRTRGIFMIAGTAFARDEWQKRDAVSGRRAFRDLVLGDVVVRVEPQIVFEPSIQAAAVGQSTARYHIPPVDAVTPKPVRKLFGQIAADDTH